MSISRSGGWPIGKLGNVVSYMLRGQLVHRTIGKQGKPSLRQKANHQSMAVTTHFLGHFKDYLNNGFELESRGTIRNQHNLAVSFNKKNALQGEFPNITIDYAKIQLSKGTLNIPDQLCMQKVSGGLQISWDPSYLSGSGSQYDDCLQLAVYFPKSRTKKVELNFSKREAGTAFLPLAAEELERSMEVYLFLSAANHDSVSDTVYLGNLNGKGGNPEITTQREEKKKNELVGGLKAKLRYEHIKEQYKVQMKLKPNERISDKAFRNLEKEYLVLMNRYESTSR